MRTCLVLGLLVVVALSAACTTPQTPAAQTTAPSSGLPQGWQTYANPAGFSISYPPSWSEQEVAQQAGQTFSTVALQGTEGGVNLSWGVGFGGACPQGYSTVTVAEGELPACYAKNADGTETWTQINKELASTSFSTDAHTSNADAASHDMVMQVLATLSFTPPQ